MPPPDGGVLPSSNGAFGEAARWQGELGFFSSNYNAERLAPAGIWNLEESVVTEDRRRPVETGQGKDRVYASLFHIWKCRQVSTGSGPPILYSVMTFNYLLNLLLGLIVFTSSSGLVHTSNRIPRVLPACRREQFVFSDTALGHNPNRSTITARVRAVRCAARSALSANREQ
ncbi:hypothetical protein E4U30_005956 [Claviceps sp. LM220 group G6]|nr:hypothetical protein E4U31_006737 [Claviceps sp. LM219 group G6]KAG6102479.1 hypothetical protein E4U30_005956 [Claviceps sp. LM220 group G6]